MWEVLPFCIPLSLLIFQPNVHIQQFCLAGDRNISRSQRLLSWQLRLVRGVGSPVFVFFSLPSHRRKWVRNGKANSSHTCNASSGRAASMESYEFHKRGANKSWWAPRWGREEREHWPAEGKLCTNLSHSTWPRHPLRMVSRVLEPTVLAILVKLRCWLEISNIIP